MQVTASVSPSESKPSYMKSRSSFWRYQMIRLFTCPLPCVSRSMPIIGGKSFLEVFIAAIFAALLLYIALWGPYTAGQVADVAGLVLVSLAVRNNIIAAFFGLTFERAVFWHKALGVLVLVLMLIHGIGLGFGITGVIMGVIMGVMSLLYILSWYGMFNLFYFGHVILYVLLIAPAYIHGAVVMAASVVLWIVDVFIRYLFTKKTVKSELSILGKDIIKISMPSKSLVYEAGQYCFLRVTAVNGYEYHPFTMSSEPNEEKITFHVRMLGDWTKDFYQLVRTKTSSQVDENQPSVSKPFECDIAVEGPYGSLSIDLFDTDLYQTVILIGGGIGITPCLSMWKHYLNSQAKPKKVILVWLVKDPITAQLMYDDQFDGKIDAEREVVIHNVDESETSTSSSSLIKDDTVFQYHFFITQKETSISTPGEGEEFKMIEAGTSQKKLWNDGRVNMNALFNAVAEHVSSTPQDGNSGGFCGRKSRVGVLVCGPNTLIRDVHRCVNSSEVRNRVRMDIHEEVFQF